MNIIKKTHCKTFKDLDVGALFTAKDSTALRIKLSDSRSGNQMVVQRGENDMGWNPGVVSPVPFNPTTEVIEYIITEVTEV